MKKQSNKNQNKPEVPYNTVDKDITSHDQSVPHSHSGARAIHSTPHSSLVICVMKTVTAFLVFFFFLIPAFIKIYPGIFRDVAFSNYITWPPFANLTLPSDHGLVGARNFRLDTAPGISIGAWHILPLSMAPDSVSLGDDDFMKLLSSGPAIILYLHGNGGSRSIPEYRVEMYKVLSQAGFHIITFDYRGYGDSTGSPTEEGLADDSIAVFKWIKEHAGRITPVYIWGHSLGSAVATRTAMRLGQLDASFHGLILESPFNNFMDGVINHPLTGPFRFLPWYTWCFIEGVKDSGIRLASDENIGDVKVNTLILHAADDNVIPYSLGQKLYDVAKRTKKTGTIEFVTINSKHNCGHTDIYRAPDFIDIVRKFTEAQLTVTD